MSVVARHAPGSFCWVDLATSDADAARHFYGELFGWSPGHPPAGPESGYTIFRLGGRDAAGMYELFPDQREQGVPPHWLSYVAVESADAAADRARALGGTVIKVPFDVDRIGRMALIRDPASAAFALWQAREHRGAGVVYEPGSFCWNELATRDPGSAGAFYSALFGWAAEQMPMEGFTYTIFKSGEQQRGGMMEMQPEWGEAPPHWMVYFAVEDADPSAARAAELGGVTLVPPTDIPAVGRFAMLRDPQGATFAIIRLNPRV